CLSNKSENAIAAVDGNICRCTGYKSIERAANKIAAIVKEKKEADAISFVTKHKILPEYFSEIKERLMSLKNVAAPIHHSPLTTHLIAGGTDLYVQKQEEMVYADSRYVFDHPELNSINREGNKCILGSSVTVSDLMASPIINEAFPLFQQYAKLISSTPIRNMATIAGNFINASPIGDFTIFFLALDAQLILSDGKIKRELPLRKLYKGYKDLDKRKEEHIEQIWFELPDKNSYFNFEKVSKRTHLDIASVNTAIHLRMNGEAIKEASLSAGGVGPVPMFLKKTSGFLIGKKVNDKIIEEIIRIMQSEISPISDARGTAAYKTLLLGQLIKSHFINISKESHESHQ
ncbi:MAG TPA: FAD binding domain-containing protein, partial [Chitinophagaceae bacterium]|nr:FAD binding domain-containing protein [Chitinophagaceae bacterium]